MPAVARAEREVIPAPFASLPVPRLAPAEEALRVVSEVAMTVAEPVELEQLSALAVDTARDLLGTDAGCLLLWQEERQRLHPAARNDPDWNPRSSYSCAPGEGLIGQTFVANRPFAVWNYPESPHALSTAVTAGIKSGLAVPLVSGGRQIGVLSVRNYYQARFTTGHIGLLMLLGSLVAPALELARNRRQRPPIRLTAREAMVLEEIMAGRPAKAIASRHGITEATVRSHIRAVLSKLGVSSQLAAVAAARELGMVPGLIKFGETGPAGSR